MIRKDINAPDLPVFNDNVLKEMYIEYGVACDSLVSNPSRLLSFTEDYVQRTGQQIESSQLAHRLLTLRKLGQDKGGLPRIRRTHHGRN